MSDNRVRQNWYGTVYLLHFSEPYHHARHYVGFTQHEHGMNPVEEVNERLNQHFDGHGNALVHTVHTRGILVVVARVWGNRTRAFERKVHNRRPKRLLCPLCAGTATVTQPALSIA